MQEQKNTENRHGKTINNKSTHNPIVVEPKFMASAFTDVSVETKTSISLSHVFLNTVKRIASSYQDQHHRNMIRGDICNANICNTHICNALVYS